MYRVKIVKNSHLTSYRNDCYKIKSAFEALGMFL